MHYDVCSDGLEAIKQFEQHAERYDIILMDCEMPHCDGFEATRAIRQYEAKTERKTTPVIALTAHHSAEMIERCRQATMDQHLSKPLDFDQLKTTLAQFLLSG